MDGAPGSYETMQQFAARLGVCKNTVKNWIKRGMPCVRQGRVVRIAAELAEEWIAAVELTPRPVPLPRELRVPIRKGRS